MHACSQNSGRALLPPVYPHQVPWNMLHAVLVYSSSACCSREDFSAVSKARLDRGKIFPRRAARA